MGYYEFKINADTESTEALISMAYESGSLGAVDNEQELIIYFSDNQGIDKLTAEMERYRNLLGSSGLSNDFKFSYVYISERDWNESWKKKFEPIQVGRNFLIIPPWEEPKPGLINLIVDPGMAFGTGHHATTRKCLEHIERICSEGSKNRFLDVGTGTGILAIGAAKLGFHEVAGVDIDPLAIDAAKRNVTHNNLDNVTILEGTIAAAEGMYDVIAANLLSEILIGIAPELASRLNEGGTAMLSGMIIGQEDGVMAAMQKQGLKFKERYYDGERWVTIIVTR